MKGCDIDQRKNSMSLTVSERNVECGGGHNGGNRKGTKLLTVRQGAHRHTTGVIATEYVEQTKAAAF